MGSLARCLGLCPVPWSGRICDGEQVCAQAHHHQPAPRSEGRCEMTGMVKLAGLLPKVSKHGTSYLVGMLGDVKVVVCEIRDRQEGDTETHAIYLAHVTQQATQQAPRP